MNRICLGGRLTRDPEIRYAQTTNGDLKIARFTLAVDRRVSREREAAGVTSADFITCKAFRHDADFVERFMKQGSRCYLEGRVETGSYTNRDGQKVYTFEVVADHVEFGDSKKTDPTVNGGTYPAPPTPSQYTSKAPAPAQNYVHTPEPNLEEELPFN